MNCANQACGKAFSPPANSKRQTCSRSCAVAISWNTDRDKRSRSISAAQQRRGADITAQNHERWARPGEREKLIQRNREAWADPDTRARLSAAIRARQSTPEMRQFYSDMRRAMWRDPEYRARVTAIVAASHRTEEYRRLFSALLVERWKDPVWREKWTAATRRRYAKVPTVDEKAAEVDKLPPKVSNPAPPVDNRSPARRAEEDAITAFMASKSVTKLPNSRDAFLTIPELKYDREKHKWVRPKPVLPA